jgi:hypothetical protein
MACVVKIVKPTPTVSGKEGVDGGSAAWGGAHQTSPKSTSEILTDVAPSVTTTVWGVGPPDVAGNLTIQVPGTVGVAIVAAVPSSVTVTEVHGGCAHHPHTTAGQGEDAEAAAPS